jgi:hypothetical protein
MLPGFKTTLEGLQGVPMIGPEFGILARGSITQLRLTVWEASMARTASQGVKVFDRLSPGMVARFVENQRHVLFWQTSEGVEFWTVSGLGGQLGHAEYTGALFLRDSGLLYRGQSLLVQGFLRPCSTEAINCSSLMDFLSRRVGIQIVYDTSALAPGIDIAGRAMRSQGLYYFEAGSGLFVQKTGTFEAPPAIHPQIVKDFGH